MKQSGELITFFCQFKSLLAPEPFAILQKIRYTDAVKEMLGKDDGKKTAKRLDLEKGLLNWLKQRSLAQIFDWFDCLEETTVKTGAGAGDGLRNQWRGTSSSWSCWALPNREAIIRLLG